MSVIAQAWVATLRVGNQTAKQLLQFYSAHNFNKPGYEFKNETLASQLEVTERAIQKAHKLLLEKKLIIKEERYCKNGRQLSSVIYLNIPQEFVDKFFGEGEPSSSLGVNLVRGEGEHRSPLNNNINNKYNNNAHAQCAPVDKKESQKEKGAPFSHMWTIYPNKKDKARAEKAWNKLTPQEKEAVLEKLPQQIREDKQWQAKEYVPMASTYLNNRRWEDEIITATPQRPYEKQEEAPRSAVNRMPFYDEIRRGHE